MAHLIFLLAISGILASAPAMAEEDCKKITAATNLGPMLILYLGEEFVMFDQRFNQIAEGPASHVFNVPTPDAVFTSTLDDVLYFFSGKEYSTVAKGPMPADTFAKSFYRFYFQNGLDAGTSVLGTTYMFINCQVILANKAYGFRPAKLPPRIPCQLDAALTVGDEVWVFKGDKVWHYPLNGQKADTPIDTVSMFHFNEDIKLCPYV